MMMTENNIDVSDAIRQLRQMQEFNYTIADDAVFDKAVEALEKQIPRKVIKSVNSVAMEFEKCPRCKSFRVFGSYCTNCGQRICR